MQFSDVTGAASPRGLRNDTLHPEASISQGRGNYTSVIKSLIPGNCVEAGKGKCGR